MASCTSPYSRANRVLPIPPGPTTVTRPGLDSSAATLSVRVRIGSPPRVHHLSRLSVGARCAVLSQPLVPRGRLEGDRSLPQRLHLRFRVAPGAVHERVLFQRPGRGTYDEVGVRGPYAFVLPLFDELRAQLEHFARVNIDVRCLPLEAAAGLMNHDAGMRQTVTLSFRTAGEQQ